MEINLSENAFGKFQELSKSEANETKGGNPIFRFFVGLGVKLLTGTREAHAPGFSDPIEIDFDADIYQEQTHACDAV